MKYAMLHKIGATNWVPTNHKSTIATVLGRFIYVVGTKAKFDYGKAAVIAMLREICKELVTRKLTLEKLICSLEMEEGVEFAENEEEVGPEEGDEQEDGSGDDEQEAGPDEEEEAVASPTDGTNEDKDSDEDNSEFAD
ncbi:uncharacterized protein LOC131617055 [Vicia villosa]|uniref:uncharacterized protein LOC131617055 n=1 Tax=Vicia villosa TaxID=3911 RepID=UPI00273C3DBE|nr:uncharacterized protein LOC131617055 [Vicia villosa]